MIPIIKPLRKQLKGFAMLSGSLESKDRLRDWDIREPDLPNLAEATMQEFLLATNPREVQSATKYFASCGKFIELSRSA